MITTDDCTFDKNTGNLFLSSQHTGGSFPSQIVIQSSHTGRTVTFTQITADHPRYDEDGWDGELSLYEPRDPGVKVRLLTIHHEM